MKPITPHDPLDDLIAAALHGELTPEERTQFDARLSNDPAARAAYQEAQLMHDLLEKTHKNAQPDPSFEQRMVSGVRRKIQQDQHQETALESLWVLWTMVKRFVPSHQLSRYAMILALVSVVTLSVLISMGNQVKSVFTTISNQLAYAGSAGRPGVMMGNSPVYTSTDMVRSGETVSKVHVHHNNLYGVEIDANGKVVNLAQPIVPAAPMALNGGNTYTGGTTVNSGTLASDRNGYVTMPPASAASTLSASDAPADSDTGKAVAMNQNAAMPEPMAPDATTPPGAVFAPKAPASAQSAEEADQLAATQEKQLQAQLGDLKNKDVEQLKKTQDNVDLASGISSAAKPQSAPGASPATPAPVEAPAIDTRKLIRDAQLDLEVKSFQSAMDQITALTKVEGGYVDTSNSQKGGNGKLQGTVVVKVLPQNLDTFLLKLRDLGQLQNQSVSTDDVTKDYYDTQARLDNSRRMETQLQDLLKRTNGRVSDLLQVERELGRVRGEIEQMQGQLKLYDFQVQYATVTMNMKETDLNQTAAYLLKETDDFALFATDVEGTFQQTRKAADDFKAHILTANLNHNSGSDVSALLVVSVPPDQIESFLAQLRLLGRVANFTRQTQRVAKDGGDTDQPADQTLTDKDKVVVNITIRSDDESRKQVALTVVTATVDDALDQAKTTALGNAGEILNSSLNKTPQGQSTAQLSVRIPGKNYHALLDAYRALGRTASFSLQRDDNSGPGANGDDAPVIVSLALTDEEAPLQQTEMSIQSTDVDKQAQQLKKDAAAAGAQVKASSFEREPNGMEMAQMTFRLPMSKYPAFVESLKQLGHVEALTVNRVDRPDQTRTDDSAPAEINLRLHNQGDIVADNSGLWATLRQTFGEGAGALFGSIRVIGVLIAFTIPWVFAIGLLAWIGRRIYIWKKK